MHTYHRTVTMRDTDATGAIYFANVQIIALEAFEDFLSKNHFDLSEAIKDGKVLFPIVHAEADYLTRITLNQKLEVRLFLEKIGTKSFSLKYDLYFQNQSLKCATAQTVHVTFCSNTNQSIQVPDEICKLLEKIS